MNEDRVSWHLDNWAYWQRAPEAGRGAAPRGYPSAASSGMGIQRRSNFDSMCDTADARCARAVDAILDGLRPIERASVHHFHLSAVFRFPRTGMSAERAYARARDAVRLGLISRGIP